MKTTLIITTILALAGIVFYLVSCRSKDTPRQAESPISKTDSNPKEHKLSENPYPDMRAMALGFTPEQLGINVPEDQTVIYGVVMEWDMGKAIITLTSFSTGDASIYLSSGTAIIGGGHHKSVNAAAKAFIDKAQPYLDKMTKTDATPLPDKHCIRFYFLTNKGKFTVQEDLTNFDNKSSSWLPLFNEGDKVITAIRIAEESKR